MTYINPAHYDNDLHIVPFTIGEDFANKWNAYREDGFSVSHGVTGEYFLAIKPLRDRFGGYDIPKTAKELR